MKWYTPLLKFLPRNLKDKKIKLILILFLTGAIFLLLPPNEKKEESSHVQVNMINHQERTKKELEKLLTKLTGETVRIVFTQKDSGDFSVITEESLLVESNPENGTSTLQKDTKPITDSNKNIMIKNRQQPAIKGVCIFYFGTYQKEVENLLYRAAKSALGAEIHTVEVIFKPNERN
ncbi:MAG: hypothetical protein J6A61_02265 [Clostridia bacterium]|nr:hypothetical protein [Clostridia bacterium]